MPDNLVLVFSSFQVDSDPNREREEEYAICYEQLLRVLPENFTVLFCDNTVSDMSELKNERLKNVVKDKLKMFYNDNIGKTNKGLGELDMLVKARSKILFSFYDSVCYLSGRKLITCPYVFEKVLGLKSDALVSNPPLFCLENGQPLPSGQNLFNDMFFGMKSLVMQAYADYAKGIIYKPTHLGSEQILFNFITSNKISHETMDFLGFIRNDWEMSGSRYTKDYRNAQWI